MAKTGSRDGLCKNPACTVLLERTGRKGRPSAYCSDTCRKLGRQLADKQREYDDRSIAVAIIHGLPERPGVKRQINVWNELSPANGFHIVDLERYPEEEDMPDDDTDLDGRYLYRRFKEDPDRTKPSLKVIGSWKPWNEVA